MSQKTMSPRTLEFFYDCSSPWTYLAFHRIEEVASKHHAQLIWKPILVGGVFNTVNPSVYASREKPVPQKAAYSRKDLADWARLYRLEIEWPKVFPVNSVKAMRGALVVLEQKPEWISAYSRAVFDAYWGRGLDISRDEILRPIVTTLELDWSDFQSSIESPAIKALLRQNTDELIERGGFGSPTMFVGGDDMYFGNDRLPLVEAALDRRS
jgi:2-hydroxychromene-2-carboxylate isomerase